MRVLMGNSWRLAERMPQASAVSSRDPFWGRIRPRLARGSGGAGREAYNSLEVLPNDFVALGRLEFRGRSRQLPRDDVWIRNSREAGLRDVRQAAA